ncbi:MAG TPA: roadblock/LC7 domain-containing protein [Thermoplasmata archaeon]
MARPLGGVPLVRDRLPDPDHHRDERVISRVGIAVGPPRPREGTRGDETLVVGDRNGLPIVSIHRSPATLAATASATIVLAAARNVASTSALSPLEDVLLEGADYKVLVRSIGNGFTLLAVLVGDVNLGMAKLLMAHQAREIGELLEMLG